MVRMSVLEELIPFGSYAPQEHIELLLLLPDLGCSLFNSVQSMQKRDQRLNMRLIPEQLELMM